MVTLCLLAAMTCLLDYRFRRIPNQLILLLLLWGIVYHLMKGGSEAVLMFALRGLSCLLLFFPMFVLRTLGAGDIKLLGVMSGFLFIRAIPVFFFFSFGYALLFYLLRCCCVCCMGHRSVSNREAAKRMRSDKTVCMAGPIWLAFVTVCWIGG